MRTSPTSSTRTKDLLLQKDVDEVLEEVRKLRAAAAIYRELVAKVVADIGDPQEVMRSRMPKAPAA
jgi:hypothetical protein